MSHTKFPARLASLTIVALALGCGSEASPAPVVAPATPTTPTTPTAPPAPAVSPPGTLVLGAPASTVAVPAVPAYTFNADHAGEYQVDATGTPDVQLLVVQGDRVVAEDSDSGDGTNARVVAFLAPGSYEARVFEWRGRALTGATQVTALELLTPVGAIAPDGAAQTVSTPAGEYRRAASAELTLDIATAGNYRIDATTAPDAGRDAEVMIHRDGVVVAEDSDSGDANNAQITHQLEPGSYRLRVRDWVNRASQISVSVHRL
ncbi:MAG: hypothetical protein K1X94_17325 [Sandaracinaceae bacterium]|nr:hypothetical protein [Sandaracinaceae bacterium]